MSPEELRFARGGRSLADLVAPAAVEVARDHLRLDAQYARVLAVTGYPRTVGPGWLRPLVQSDLPLEVAVHVYPLDSAEMVRALSFKLVQLQSSRLAQLREERIADPEREVAVEDAERLRDSLARGDERVFSVGLYILVRAQTRRALDDLTHRVEATLDGMLAHSRTAIWEQERGFHTCLPEGRDELLVYRNLDTTSLAMTLPLVGGSLSMDGGVLYGVSPATQSPIIVDPFDRTLENANLVVVAPSGSGKSYFVKLLALRNLVQGVDFLVIDPEDEYRAVCTAAGGQYIRLASSSPHRLNPFDLPARGAVDDAEGQDPLGERVTALHALLAVMLTTGGGDPPDARERAALDRALYETYARSGITADPSTHSRPAPLLRDLHQVLVEAHGELAAGLATRLEPFVQGSLAAGMFSGPTNVELDGRLVVFTIQQLADELRPLAIQVIAGHVWNRVRRHRRPRLLIVDEAWRLFEHPEGGAFLAGLARRARKYWLGLITISQLVADFVDDRHGKAGFQNAPMKLILKQDSDGIDRAAEVLKLADDERRLLLAADRGEGLLFARGSRVHITIQASQAEHRLATTAPSDLAALQLGAPGGQSREGGAA
jgi:conjugal transfer ATP-binding protein TraC